MEYIYFMFYNRNWQIKHFNHSMDKIIKYLYYTMIYNRRLSDK